MNVRSLFGVVFGAALVSASSVASAAPITIQYLVTLNERCIFQDGDGGQVCGTINEQFLLGLTFDDGVTNTVTFFDPGVEAGANTLLDAPTFTVPASLMPIADPIGGGGPPAASLGGLDQEVPDARSELAIADFAMGSSEIFNNGTLFRRRDWFFGVGLTTSRLFSGPQDLVVTLPTSAEIVERLNGGLGPIDVFLFNAFSEFTCQLDVNGDCSDPGFFDFADGSASVSGTAVVVTQAVPEPATLCLVGLGLLASRLRGRRRS
jgi:hypothetical protein